MTVLRDQRTVHRRRHLLVLVFIIDRVKHLLLFACMVPLSAHLLALPQLPLQTLLVVLVLLPNALEVHVLLDLGDHILLVLLILGLLEQLREVRQCSNRFGDLPGEDEDDAGDYDEEKREAADDTDQGQVLRVIN